MPTKSEFFLYFSCNPLQSKPRSWHVIFHCLSHLSSLTIGVEISTLLGVLIATNVAKVHVTINLD